MRGGVLELGRGRGESVPGRALWVGRMDCGNNRGAGFCMTGERGLREVEVRASKNGRSRGRTAWAGLWIKGFRWVAAVRRVLGQAGLQNSVRTIRRQESAMVTQHRNKDICRGRAGRESLPVFFGAVARRGRLSGGEFGNGGFSERRWKEQGLMQRT